MLGVLDLKSVAYFKIKQGILQQNPSKYYRFEAADTLCEHFNRFINTLMLAYCSLGLYWKGS